MSDSRMKKFILFGIGNYFLKKAVHVPELLLSVVAYCDSNKPKNTTEFLGKPFITPESIKDFIFDEVVIATATNSNYTMEIREMLINQCSIPPERLSHIDDYLLMQETTDITYDRILDHYWKLKGQALEEQMNSAGQLKPENLKECKVLPNKILALDYMPKDAVTAEVGVAYGAFSEQILMHMQPRKFHAIDYFSQQNPYHKFWDLDYFRRDNMPHQQWYEKKFKNEIASGQMEIHQGFSWDVLSGFPDDYFDYVCVDAAHDYESVRKDIAALRSKVKDGGYLQFNDYTLVSIVEPCYFGVVPAVNEYLNSGGHEVVFLCLHPRGYYDLVVKVNKS